MNNVSKALVKRIRGIVGSRSSELLKRLPEWLDACTPTTFRSMELEVAASCRELADEVVEQVLLEILANDDFIVSTRKAARAGLAPLRNGGARKVSVMLLSGRKVEVHADYLRPDLSNKPGPRRGHGRRGKGGAGLYPALRALGIDFGVTPALAAEVTRQVTDSDSVRAGAAALERRGIDLEYKQVLRISTSTGARAMEQRDRWLSGAFEGPAKSGPLKNKRVVVAVDGGRLRERVERGGRPRAATGRHGFDAPWREPKLFTIYTIDAQGRVRKAFRPVYDGTLDDANATFAMLVAYLKALGAHEAKAIDVLGDGASWIWDRVPALVDLVGIPSDRVTETVDWYHATEHLAEVAKAHSKWTEEQRGVWLKKAKKILHGGDIDGLMEHFDTIAVGRRASAINAHRGYFQRNADRMQYGQRKAAKKPLGSGAIESAIRMIVNMRLKSAGKYWLRDNAQSMLLLRSSLKAGRFDDLFDRSATQAAAWWEPALEDAPPAPIAEAAK
jgi:hypothetical protein